MNDYDRIARLNKLYSRISQQPKNIGFRHTPKLLLDVLKLGYPKFVDDKEVTARVGITQNNRFMFEWNREFFDSLSDVELAFTCIHESMHLLLNHLSRMKDRVNYIWNVACDLVINTSINDFMYLQGGPLFDKIVTYNNFGFKFYRLLDYPFTAETVYDRLMKSCTFKLVINPSNPGSYKVKIKPNNSNDEFEYEFGSHEQWQDKFHAKLKGSIKDLVDKLESGSYFSSRAYWTSLEEEIQRSTVEETWKIPWSKLLRGYLTSSRKPLEGESWSRPHKKLMSMYPNIILPNVSQESVRETSKVFIAADSSGSIDNGTVTKISEVMDTFPLDDFELKKSWFDTSVYMVEDFQKVYGRGGTSLAEVEMVLIGASKYKNTKSGIWETCLEPYPDIVMAITDGHFPPVTVKYPDRWLILLVQGGTTENVQSILQGGGIVFELRD